MPDSFHVLLAELFHLSMQLPQDRPGNTASLQPVIHSYIDTLDIPREQMMHLKYLVNGGKSTDSPHPLFLAESQC